MAASAFQFEKNKRQLFESRVITVEMSEHDVSRILVLIQEEILKGEEAWQGYWQRMARKIELSVEKSVFNRDIVNKFD